MAKEAAMEFAMSGKTYCVLVATTWRFRVPIWPKEELRSKQTSDAFWILYAPEQEIKHCTAENLEFFDAVLSYTAPSSNSKSNNLDLRHADLPGFEDAVVDILRIIEPSRLRLVGMTELCLRVQAHMRQTYKIPGPMPEDYERFTCKIAMQRQLTAAGVPTAPYMTLNMLHKDPSVEGCQAFLREMRTQIGYPSLLKPANAASCRGIIPMGSQSDLIAAFKQAEPNVEYFIERCISHDLEYTPTVIVYDNKIVGELDVTLTIGNILEDHRNQQMAFGSVTVDPDTTEYAEVMAITRQAFEAMKPVPDGLFNIQVMRERDTGRLVAGEVCVRVTGFDTELIFASTRMCTELLLIRTQVPDFLIPQIHCSCQAACLRFYQCNGVLKCKNEECVRNNISSALSMVWSVEEGEEMRIPEGAHHEEIATVILRNKNYQALLKDFRAVKYELQLFEITTSATLA